MTSSARPRRSQLVEFVFTLLTVAGLLWSLVDYFRFHRLPQPFYFGLNESLTDWFVTALYAHQSGAYDYEIFSSIYPPVSFLFMKLTTLPACYMQDAYYARGCDTLAQFVILLSYLGSVAIAWYAFWKNDRSTAWMRGLTFGISFPLLFALERGNTIMVGFIFFVLGYGGVTRSRVGQLIGIAMAINFKPYLLAPAAADVLKRHWRFCEQIALMTAFIYVTTFALFGEGDPLTIVANIQNFSGATVSFIWERIYYATSLESFTFFDSYRFPTRDFIPGRYIEIAHVVIYIFMYTSLALMAVVFAAAWARPEAVPRIRLASLLLSLHLVTAAEGGYLFIFIVFLTFMERGNGKLVMGAVVCAYLQSIPYDIVLTTFITLNGDSWLSGRTTEFAIGPAVGMFLRPMLLNVMVWLVCWDSILKVTRTWRGNPPLLRLGHSRPLGPAAA